MKTSRREMPINETRDRILEAALALFREKGFVEATMREVASSSASVRSGRPSRPVTGDPPRILARTCSLSTSE